MSQNNMGYIKLFRKTLDNPLVCKDADHYAVWCYLLTKSAHKGYDMIFAGKRITLQPGQLITGRAAIGAHFKINEKKVDRILKAFENGQQIEQLTTPQGRLISVLNWDLYQANDLQSGQQVGNDCPTSGQQVGTNNNDKKEKNDKNNKYSSEFELFWSNYPRKLGKPAAQKCFATRIKEGFRSEDLIQSASNYASSVAGTDIQYIKHASTFIGPDKHFLDFISIAPTDSNSLYPPIDSNPEPIHEIDPFFK